MARTFEYAEKPAGVIMGRRGLFKVVGLCAIAAGATGWAVNEIIENRNCVLLARQKGLYKDDKLCQAMKLTSSHQNPTVQQIYRDFGFGPNEGPMYKLLHTHYYERSMLAAAAH